MIKLTAASIIIYLCAYSAPANSLDIGFGAGAGYCSGWDSSDPYNYCEAGVVTKFFVRARHRVSESVEIEGEVYHFSHPEKQDFHPSQFDDRTSDLNGVTINAIYWFK